MSESLKRNSKDSVFSKLFEDENNILRLYKEIHPEDSDVDVKDIKMRSIETFILNGQYNDLGFSVKDKYILLIEAQSTWSMNILVRMLFYIVETLRRYLESTEQSVHQCSKVKLPIPELYVFYSGKEKRPEIISLNEEFFEGKSGLDVKIRVFSKVDETLAGQYIGFCRVFDELRISEDEPLEIAKAIYKTCIDKGYLVDFMKSHEKEVVNMMYTLFDEEYARKQYDIAMQREKRENEAKILAKGIEVGRAEGRAEGREEGRAKGREEGRADTIREVFANLIKSGMTEQQARDILRL